MAWRNFSSRSGDEADYIIVGSGPSGLVCASLLAEKNSVMVLEGHPDGVPGGTLHTFKQGGADVCCGLHYTGTQSTLARALLYKTTSVGGDAGLPFTEDRESTFDTCVLPTADGNGNNDNNNGEHKFIHLKPGNFEQLMQIPMKCWESVSGSFNILVLVKMLCWPMARLVWFLYVLFGYRREASMNYTEWCKEKTTAKLPVSDEQIHIWNTNAGDHGMHLHNTPAIMGVAIMKHYSKGQSFYSPVDAIRRMCANIKEKKSEVVVHAVVEQLIFDSAGKCSGVIVADGHTSTTLRARKGVVVTSTFALETLLTKAKRMPDDLAHAFKKCGPSVGHGCLFLTYKDTTAEALGLDHKTNAQFWIHADPATGKASFEKGLFVSAKQHGTTVLVYVLWEMEYVNRDGDYEDKKMRAVDEAKRYVFKLFPKLAAAHIDTEDSSTPASTQKYLLTNGRGSSYGLAAAACRFGDYDVVRALRPEIPSVPGLWLSGQDVLSLGVVGAMFSGVLTAQAILHRGIFDFFTNNVVQDMIKEYTVAKKRQETKSKSE